MINPNEVTLYFNQVKTVVDNIEDPIKQHNFITKALSKYTLAEWCDIGYVLKEKNII